MSALPAGPTKYVVVSLLLLVFGSVMWTLLDPVWFAVCAALLLLEGWTLVNRYAGDTISEVVWYLNARPVVPFAFGLAVASLLRAGGPPPGKGGWIAFLIGGLMGHFFFSRMEDEEEE